MNTKIKLDILNSYNHIVISVSVKSYPKMILSGVDIYFLKLFLQIVLVILHTLTRYIPVLFSSITSLGYKYSFELNDNFDRYDFKGNG